MATCPLSGSFWGWLMAAMDPDENKTGQDAKPGLDSPVFCLRLEAETFG